MRLVLFAFLLVAGCDSTSKPRDCYSHVVSGSYVVDFADMGVAFDDCVSICYALTPGGRGPVECNSTNVDFAVSRELVNCQLEVCDR